jgi:hypothetical protein
MQITQEDNLVLQSYITTSLLFELKNNNFVGSDFFERMSFEIPWFKDKLRDIGIDNQGCLLMALYAMLVIPYEIVSKKFPAEYDAVNNFLQIHTINPTTNYRKDSPNIDFIGHLRNSIAHARFSFRPNESIIFSDRDDLRNGQFSAELPLEHLWGLVNKLHSVHVAYVEKMRSRT